MIHFDDPEDLNDDSGRTDKRDVILYERLQEIMDNYNADSSSVESDFEELMKFAESLREEEERLIRKGLTEDELEIYALLCKEKR